MRGSDERDDREDQERDRKLGKGSREVERFVRRYPRRQAKCGSDSHLHLYFEIYNPSASNLRWAGMNAGVLTSDRQDIPVLPWKALLQLNHLNAIHP